MAESHLPHTKAMDETEADDQYHNVSKETYKSFKYVVIFDTIAAVAIPLLVDATVAQDMCIVTSTSKALTNKVSPQKEVSQDAISV